MNEPHVIILDSSGIISLLHSDDSLHDKALRLAEPLTDRRIDWILPAEVFAESMNVIGKKRGNAEAVRQGELLLIDKRFFLQGSQSKIISEALTKLRHQKSSVSFIDCLVMAWADHRHTKHIFGFDGAFAANGYSLP